MSLVGLTLACSVIIKWTLAKSCTSKRVSDDLDPKSDGDPDKPPFMGALNYHANMVLDINA